MPSIARHSGGSQCGAPPSLLLLPSRRSHHQRRGSIPAAAGAGARREGGRPGEEGRHRRVVSVQILLYPTRDRERDVWKETGGTREVKEKPCHLCPIHCVVRGDRLGSGSVSALSTSPFPLSLLRVYLFIHSRFYSIKYVDLFVLSAQEATHFG